MDQRHRINMTSREFFWTAGSILLLGVLTGWGLFSTPGLGEDLVVNTGNVADWLAATGTWVIGFGAWKYARANHEHTVALARDARIKELRGTASGLHVLITIVSRAHVPKLSFEALDETRQQFGLDFKSDMLVTALERSLHDLRLINWLGPERALLSAETLARFTRSEFQCSSFEMRAVDALKDIEKGEHFELESGTVKALRTSAEKIATTLKPVADFLRRERTRVNKELEALEKRVSAKALS